MKIKRFALILMVCVACLPGLAATGQISNDSLLNQLDNIIANREVYYKEKENRLDSLHKKLAAAGEDKERFETLASLFREYHSYNADSAYSISQRQYSLAKKMGEKNLIIDALLNRANSLCLVGMYHETLQVLDSIPVSEVPDYLRPYYFHTNRTVYGNLDAYAAFKPEKEYYAKLTDAYRDSLLTVNDPNSIFHVLIKADQLNVHHKPQEAIRLLENFMNNNQLSEHERAICAFTLSDSYGLVKDIPNQKRQLMISAIADMKSAVREYVSLRQLALLLYQEGDLERAYSFLTLAIDDATKSNARQRIVELNDSYPAINGIYVNTVQKQKKNLERTIFIITILSVILICLLFYMRKQMVRLNELNHRLVQSNSKLQDAYTAIAEISELKEVYICQYMNQSLEYIERLDSFRKSIARLVNAGKTADLQKLVKSSKMIDDELKSFYAQFDTTFLNLFPNFVEDFNKLLLPEEAIIPKKPGTLNAELRIFALIRLGITDSDQIAKFLNYSLTTIYNYRTRVRNKAKGDRNNLENEVAKIGRNS